MKRFGAWSHLLLSIQVLVACGGAPPAPAVPAAAEAPALSPATTSAAPAASAAPVKPEPSKPEPIARTSFGKLDGRDVDLYTLTNPNGLVLKVTSYGAIVTELWLPDRNGQLADVVAGYESLDGYLKSSPYFGATVGRIANRIKNAEFKLEGKTYDLAANDGPHHLHGGKKGWDKVIWSAKPAGSPSDPALELSYVSSNGEEGYPGTVTATVTYTLTSKNELKIDMKATTDQTTIVNMAHHSYWNLGGAGSGTIKDHVLTIHSDQYTPGVRSKPDTAPVPDGTSKPVAGTPFDFRSATPIGKNLEAAGGKPAGYDNYWLVNGAPHALRPVATVKDPRSGRVLTLEADQPGVQFYTGNFLDGTLTGKGATYHQHQAFCLETQAPVNAINVPAWRGEVILKPGQTYQQHMVHRFTVE